MVVNAIYHSEDGVSYQFSDDATAAEKEAIRSYGVTNADEIEAALEWYEAVQTATTVDEIKEIRLGKHPTKDKRIGRPNNRRGPPNHAQK